MAEQLVLIISFFILFAALLGQIIGIVFYRNIADSKVLLATVVISTALLGVLLALRWLSVGRPPVYGTYESMLLAAFSSMAIYFAVKKYDKKGVIRLVSIVLALFLLAFGMFSDKTPAALGAAFKSQWLWFHIGFAWLAFASFFSAAIIAGIDLFKKKKDANAKDEMYENLSFKLIIFGFISHTIEIGSGIFWAKDLYGVYWGWDPIETWSLIIWVLYALYMHLRVTLGWKGKKMSLLALVIPFAVIMAYGGVVFLNGLHAPLI